MAALALDPTSNGNQDFITAIQGDTRLWGCIQCGTCSGVCPYGYLMEYPPSRMIAALRSETFAQVIAGDTLWMCVACSACTSACPAQLPLTEHLLTRTKEELLLSGNIPTELQSALENSQRYGNPLGESPRKRMEWAQGMTPPVPLLGKDTRQVDVLWFVGDYPSYHPRVQPASRAFVRLLQALKVDFATLGSEENSDGDSQRLAGERGLFEMLAEKNGKAFRKYEFNTILTTDPHAFNVLQREYPALGIEYPVMHYTQYLAARLDELRPMLTKPLATKVTYHDPCYLGRVNEIYDEPRALLSAIPGLELVEMSHNHANSLCCGGGGGGMWMDGFHWEKAHTRVSEWRVREAAQAGAEILAVACPYEIPRFEDAIKTLNLSDRLAVKDISELLNEAIQTE